jgi:phage terminase small subunit
MTGKRQPPGHLRPSTKVFWTWLNGEYELEPPHENLLLLGCEALDRAAQAREILASEGLTVRDDRGNSRPHPLLAAERNSQIVYARMLRELGLDAAGNSSAPRPPPLRFGKGR